MEERIIWQNNPDVDDYREGFMECEDASMDIYDYVNEEVQVWLGDEKLNLDIPTDGVIVAIADVGSWNGGRMDHMMLNANVNSILSKNYGGDYLKFYVDDENVRCTATNHDASTYILFRELNEGIESDDIEYTDEWVEANTKSIRPLVAGVYGW